jgi:large subunit ribosomal protein L17
MFRNLTANLILHERIETTDAKAKELRRVAERLITKAVRLGEKAYTPQDKLDEKQKAERLATQRLIGAFIPRWGVRVEKGGESKKVDLVEKVMVELSKRYASRPGGYTRIVKLGPRRGDNAPMCFIELVGAMSDGAKKDKKAKAEKAEPAEAVSAG